ncbi:MAG: glucuronate isomerase [Lentisphaerae bacterium]|nr:glucuronate isomerase [Lentisphaerota bacterium]MCP4102354.1 glucuronate isomerase [Lentisphaerota bacterium]
MKFLGKKYLITNDAGCVIYKAIKDLPIIDPHNHADVKEIAENNNYSNVWQLFAATDHYVWEVLRKRGVPEEYLTGDREPKEKWLKLASVFPELVGNPVYEWVHLDLRRYLGIETLIGPDTGVEIWKNANKVLSKKEKRPQQLLREIGVETMCSTDDPVDLLKEHDCANEAFGRKMIRPTWRPDKAMKIANSGWREYMDEVSRRFNMKLDSIHELVAALKLSHDYFAEHGCVASDHGVEMPLRGTEDPGDADVIFCKAMDRKSLSDEEVEIFMSYIFGQAAEMNAEKDWVFQIHMGAVRDVRDYLSEKLGPDTGGDVCNHFQDHFGPLKDFLNRFDDRLKVILYNLDPSHQAMLATMSRAFGYKVRLGSAWWLLDNPIGMRRQLEYIGSVDVLASFAGMVSDSRKLLSYGSRFEMFRRVLADVLGEMAERGQAPLELLIELASKMSYSGPKEFFNL